MEGICNERRLVMVSPNKVIFPMYRMDHRASRNIIRKLGRSLSDVYWNLYNAMVKANAWHIEKLHGKIRYVEGWAVSETGVYEHAWIEDGRGLVIDPALVNHPHSFTYFPGVFYTREELLALNPHKDDFPLVHKGNGELGMDNPDYQAAYGAAFKYSRGILT
jgi:hypothetical protein